MRMILPPNLWNTNLLPTPLARQIVTTPKLIDSETASVAVARWFDELSPPERAPIDTIINSYPAIRTIFQSLSESSPFLWDLVTRDPTRLSRLLESDPATHLAMLLTDTAQTAATADSETIVMRVLRHMKAEAALLIALADIGGVWTSIQTTRALTAVADTAVAAAVRFALSEAAHADRILPKNSDKPQQDSGYFVLAMGKMGALELNYSSDIDLIMFYDQDSSILPENAIAATTFVRITQRVVKLLQERTGDGYVFRTDLRLRPDPLSTAIAISTTAALSYYESVGQNWERAAMIKARPCAGDLAAGEKLLTELIPFVWRKYLDFAAVADVHAMKQKINAYRGHGKIAVEGHNIKLGRGGIREIEFFVQTQQLIAGGRSPDLRERDTLIALDKLERNRWIDATTCEDMKAAYCFLRTVEHRLQMVNDEQTHTLPDSREDLERFSRFFGFDDRGTFAAALLEHLNKVQQAYSRLFERKPAFGREQLLFPADIDDHKTLDRLSEIGFGAPLAASSIIREWFSDRHHSLKDDAIRTQLKELLPILLEQLGRSDDPNAALLLFDQFLSNLHGARRFLALLVRNPDLLALITLILSVAPRLADILARYPQIMDGLVDPRSFGTLPTENELNERLSMTLVQARDEEELLERIRLFGLEQMFLVGVRVLTGTITARQAGEAFARLADSVIRAVHQAVADNLTKTYGKISGGTTAILAMGKLGGYEMTATSDLDLILIYQFDLFHPESSGSHSLYGGQYFARLTQRLINALTVPTNYGRLYDVDMRLRPSGRSGPLATQIEHFADYQANEAWTWEHMALTRARVVSAPPEFGMKIQQVIRDVLRRPRDPSVTAEDVLEMRKAIAKEKPDNDLWDLKYVTGGLIDLEFIAQYLQLVHSNQVPDILDTSTARVLEKAWRFGLLTAEDGEALRSAVQLYQDLTQVLRLCLVGRFDPKMAGPDLLRLLTRAADVPDFPTLEATLRETQSRVRMSFERILGRAI
jgi:[glutamine synthetase] adenylyltransferase / [glutamine synthetase]-adenylyl-L-tyrosine phosphorylase